MHAISDHSNLQQWYNEPAENHHDSTPITLHSGAVTRIYCLAVSFNQQPRSCGTMHLNGTNKSKQYPYKTRLFVVPFTVRRLRMEEQRFYSSRRGYCAHLKKLLTKANEIIETHCDTKEGCHVTTITDLRDQLQQKNQIISKLDSQMVGLIQDEAELEADVCKAEDINASLSTSIAPLTQFLEAHKICKVEEHIPVKIPPINEDTQPP